MKGLGGGSNESYSDQPYSQIPSQLGDLKSVKIEKTITNKQKSKYKCKIKFWLHWILSYTPSTLGSLFFVCSGYLPIMKVVWELCQSVTPPVGSLPSPQPTYYSVKCKHYILSNKNIFTIFCL